DVLEALLVGIFFSFFLIKFSRFEIKNNEIYLIPSKAFIFILFGLLILRIIIKLIIGSNISFGETSGMFFLLGFGMIFTLCISFVETSGMFFLFGFGMIFTWRIAMLIKYLKLKNKLK